MKDQELQADPELTFKPKINKRPPIHEASEKTSKWEQLHSQAEKYWLKKFDRELDTVEWAKDPDAYTFKPEILGDRRAGKEMPLLGFTKK